MAKRRQAELRLAQVLEKIDTDNLTRRFESRLAKILESNRLVRERGCTSAADITNLFCRLLWLRINDYDNMEERVRLCREIRIGRITLRRDNQMQCEYFIVSPDGRIWNGRHYV